MQATTRSYLCGLVSVPQLAEFKFVYVHFLLQLVGRGLVQVQLAIDFELLLLQSLRKYEMPACLKIVAISLSLGLKQGRAERRKQYTPARTLQHLNFRALRAELFLKLLVPVLEVLVGPILTARVSDLQCWLSSSLQRKHSKPYRWCWALFVSIAFRSWRVLFVLSETWGCCRMP